MKLTPPAPQHPTRRLKFFLEHPEWKGAAYWTQRLREELSYKKFRHTHTVVEDYLLMGARTLVKHFKNISDPADQQVREKRPFLKRIFQKIRKASQRGN
jgi:hypothetical protein